ncbi:hypothetical protein LCGC14_1738940, partial [marine sediment metagenome]
MPPLYQDIWVKGKVQTRGQRECAKRYELIRRFCAQYQRPFTVLDIGAADGYFAVRLAEDFPECTVVAVEPRERIGEVLKLNDQQRVLWLNKALTAENIHKLTEVEHFDVTLALSVIHWLKVPPAWSLGALRELGDHLILEVPVEAAATGQAIVEAITLPPDGVLLGYGESHLDPKARRPIYVFSQTRTTLAKHYWGEDRRSTRQRFAITIGSSFESKTFTKGETRPWLRGINLQTFLVLNGVQPSREHIAECVRTAMSPKSPHGDLTPWNVILQGDRVALIDAKPEGVRASEDATFLEKLIATILDPGYTAPPPVAKRIRRLSLGTGDRLIKRHKNAETVHHDLTKHRPEIDVAHDLNELPWPWLDNSFDFIEAWAVLEHLKLSLFESFDECWRIMRPGGRLRVKVPRWDAEVSWDDPSHRWKFTLHSFDYFDPDTKKGKTYTFYTPRKWKIEWCKLSKPNGPSIAAELTVRK